MMSMKKKPFMKISCKSVEFEENQLACRKMTKRMLHRSVLNIINRNIDNNI